MHLFWTYWPAIEVRLLRTPSGWGRTKKDKPESTVCVPRPVRTSRAGSGASIPPFSITQRREEEQAEWYKKRTHFGVLVLVGFEQPSRMDVCGKPSASSLSELNTWKGLFGLVLVKVGRLLGFSSGTSLELSLFPRWRSVLVGVVKEKVALPWRWAKQSRVCASIFSYTVCLVGFVVKIYVEEQSDIFVWWMPIIRICDERQSKCTIEKNQEKSA